MQNFLQVRKVYFSDAQLNGGITLEKRLQSLPRTSRVVYAVRFPRAVHVLHAFQKKSVSGIATQRPDVALIDRRLRTVIARYGPGRSD